MKAPVFSMSKIKTNGIHADYDVKYFVALSKEDTTNMSQKEFLNKTDYLENAVKYCFREFKDMFTKLRKQSGNPPNRFRYLCKRSIHQNKNVHLNEDEIRWWTELCKKYKFMPSNIGENFIKNDIFDIDISGISLNKMYAYVSAARYVQDEPFFVRAVVHMVDDLGMGFLVSFDAATRFCITNTNHHLMSHGREYKYSMVRDLNKVKDFEFDVVPVAKLFKFMNGGDNGKKLKSLKQVGHYTLFDAIRYMDVKATQPLKITKCDLRRKRLERVLRKSDLSKPFKPLKRAAKWK